MRTMLTQSLAVLMPFNVQELNDPGGHYYGINQVSKNINDIVNIGLHFILKNIRPYAASCSEA